MLKIITNLIFLIIIEFFSRYGAKKLLKRKPEHLAPKMRELFAVITFFEEDFICRQNYIALYFDENVARDQLVRCNRCDNFQKFQDNFFMIFFL